MQEDMIHAINELYRFGVMRLDGLEHSLKEADEKIRKHEKELTIRRKFNEKMQEILKDVAKEMDVDD